MKITIKGQGNFKTINDLYFKPDKKMKIYKSKINENSLGESSFRN